MTLDDIVDDDVRGDAGSAAFEQQCLKKLVAALGTGDLLQRLQGGYSGPARLTVPLWYVTFPSFPVNLVCRRVRDLHGITVADLLKRYRATPLAAAFATAVGAVPVDRVGLPTALITNWPGAGMVVVHDAPFRPVDVATRLSWLDQTAPIHVDPLPAFAAALPRMGW